ncbi:hypothetical protein [Mariprofundus ferrooxydans]|uniref:hypothetical protein n=1 Tax=Mariprofundus ferrooxydans TaxID=314344 RepID=UPI00142FCE7B|nr:hypothetical protein [Mariprofundus ferrooxydans]
MANVLTRKRSISIKRQAVLGTLETLLAADGIGDIADFSFAKPDTKRINTENMAQQSFGHTIARYDDGASVLPMTLTVPVYRAAAPGSIPGNGVSEILAGLCGLTETINAGVSVVYAPNTPADLINAPRASLELIEGGDSYPLVDARGNVVLTGKPGQDLQIKTDLKAPFALPTPGASPISVSDPAGTPMRFTGSVAVTKDAAAIDIGSLELDLGLEVVEVPYSGGTRIIIKNGKPMLKIPTNAVVGETRWQQLRSATSFTLQATWSGLVIDMTARRSDLAPEDQDGTFGNMETFEVLTYSLTFN